MRLFGPKRMQLVERLAPAIGLAHRALMLSLPPHRSGDEERILIFEPFLLGDFVMTTSAFRLIREQRPKARIECVGPAFLAGTERFFPWIDEIIPFRCPWSPRYRDWSVGNVSASLRLLRDLRRRRYGWAFATRGDLRDKWFLYGTGAVRRVSFDLSGGAELLTDVVPFAGRPWTHQVEGNVLVVGHPFGITPSSADCDPVVHVPEADREAAREWLAARGVKEFVAVHPGASMPHRKWPAASWIELLNRHVLPHHPVVLFGSPDEDAELRALAAALEPASRVTIAELPLDRFFSALSLARGVICLDSAAAHIGGAVGVPVVALLGTTPPEIVRPYSPRARAVFIADVPCRPCHRACTQPRNFCLQDIPPERVAASLHDAGIL